MVDPQSWADHCRGAALSKLLIQLCHDKKEELLTGLQTAASMLAADDAPLCMHDDQSLSQIYQELSVSEALEEFAFVASWTCSPLSSNRPGPSAGTVWVQGSTAAVQTSSQSVESLTSRASQQTWNVNGRWLVVKQSGRAFDVKDSKDQDLNFLIGKKADCYSLVFQPSQQTDIPPQSCITNEIVCISSSIDPAKRIRVESKGVKVRDTANYYICKDLCVWLVAHSKNKSSASKQASGSSAGLSPSVAAAPRLPVKPNRASVAATGGSLRMQMQLGIQAASMMATTTQAREEVVDCFNHGKVEELVWLLQHRRQFIGRLSDIKNKHDRSLLSLLCSENPDCPRQPGVQPVLWRVKLELYHILLDFNEPNSAMGSSYSRPYERRANPTQELLLSLHSSENNNKARPLHQLMHNEECTAQLGQIPFLAECLKDLQILPPEQRLQEVLLAMSKGGWQPYHNAVKLHSSSALRIILEATVNALIEFGALPQPATSPGQDDTPPSSKRQRSMIIKDEIITGIDKFFYHPASKHYQNSELLEATLASVLCNKYGRIITADELKLQTASNKMKSEQPSARQTVANTIQCIASNMVNNTTEQPPVAGQLIPRITQEAGPSTTALPQHAVTTATQPSIGLVEQQQSTRRVQVQQPSYMQQYVQGQTFALPYITTTTQHIGAMHGQQQPPAVLPISQQMAAGQSMHCVVNQQAALQRLPHQWQPAMSNLPAHDTVFLRPAAQPITAQPCPMPFSSAFCWPGPSHTPISEPSVPHAQLEPLPSVEQPTDVMEPMPFTVAQIFQQPVSSTQTLSWLGWLEGRNSHGRPSTPESHPAVDLQAQTAFEDPELALPTSITTTTAAAAVGPSVMGTEPRTKSLDELLLQIPVVMPESHANMTSNKQ